MTLVATLALLAGLMAPLPAQADAPYWDDKDIDDLIEAYLEANPGEGLDGLDEDDPGIPGISVAVVQDGELVYSDGFGYADLDNEVAATADSVYSIASVSKAIAGTLAVKLEADPAVDLNLGDWTSDHLPQNEDGTGFDAAFGIDDEHFESHRLRHLLTHRGCVPHYSTDPGRPNTSEHFPSDLHAAGYVGEVGLIERWGSALQFEDCTIGDDVVYSTPAFTLLGAALEGSTGENINVLLDGLFSEFDLASMRTQFGEDGELLPNTDRVVPYHISGEPRDWPVSSWKRLGGGIESNVVDLARFGWHVLDGDIVDGEDLEALWFPYASGRALGWQVGTDPRGRSIAFHGGLQNVGARSELRVFREEGLVVAVLSNRGRFSDDDSSSHRPDRLANSIADVVLYTPPELTVDHEKVTVNEGEVATNQGAISTAASASFDDIHASVGKVERSWDGSWSWSLQTAKGPRDSVDEVTITAIDDQGGEGTVTFELVVENVAPTVTIHPDQVKVIDEGDTVTVTAAFTDPGWEDTHEVDIDWGVPPDHPGQEVDEPSFTITKDGDPGELREGEVTGTYRYGDTDMGEVFEIVVTVTDDDGGVGSAALNLTVDNVAPTIDEVVHEHDTVDLADGGDAILASPGDLLEFDVQVTDPGSDDLRLDADFGDGTQWSDQSLVNDPYTEPEDLPSPTVAPRDETFSAAHTYNDACVYQATFTATDDDGGVSAPVAIDVLVTGTADRTRSAGYWMSEYHQRGRATYTPATLACFLAIMGQLSEVFHDEVVADTLDDAAEVLHPSNARGQMTVQFDRQLLAAWANFASGSIGHDELVDTTGDGNGDIPFHEVVAAAEEVRLDDDATRGELEDQKDILEQINTR